MALGDDLHMARATEEFRLFVGLCGYPPRTTEDWAPFALLVKEHGWPRLLRAARQLHGQKNVYARDYAALCIQYKKDAEDEMKEIKAKAASETPSQRASDEDFYRIWLPYYVERGSYSKAFREIAARLGKTLP